MRTLSLWRRSCWSEEPETGSNPGLALSLHAFHPDPLGHAKHIHSRTTQNCPGSPGLRIWMCFGCKSGCNLFFSVLCCMLAGCEKKWQESSRGPLTPDDGVKSPGENLKAASGQPHPNHLSQNVGERGLPGPRCSCLFPGESNKKPAVSTSAGEAGRKGKERASVCQWAFSIWGQDSALTVSGLSSSDHGCLLSWKGYWKIQLGILLSDSNGLQLQTRFSSSLGACGMRAQEKPTWMIPSHMRCLRRKLKTGMCVCQVAKLRKVTVPKSDQEYHAQNKTFNATRNTNYFLLCFKVLQEFWYLFLFFQKKCQVIENFLRCHLFSEELHIYKKICNTIHLSFLKFTPQQNSS
jgi:hypothetical protein